MRSKIDTQSEEAEKAVRDIRRAARRHFSAEDKVRIVIAGLRGEDSVAELCRKEGINQNLYYRWSKDFLEAGKKLLAGDTAREATALKTGHRGGHLALFPGDCRNSQTRWRSKMDSNCRSRYFLIKTRVLCQFGFLRRRCSSLREKAEQTGSGHVSLEQAEPAVRIHLASSHKSEEMKRSGEPGPAIEPRKIARMKR